MKALKGILIAAVIIFLVGAGLAIGGLAVADFRWENLSGESDYKTVTGEYDVSQLPSGIMLDCGSADINAGVSPDGKIHLIYEENDAIHYDVNTDGGTLTVVRNNTELTFRSWRLWFRHPHTITLLIPENYAGNVTLESTSGSISGTNLTLAGAFTIRASSGEIVLQNNTLVSLEGTTTSGRMNINADVSGTLELVSSSGEIKIAAVSCGAAELTASSGRILLSDSCKAASGISVTTSSGSIRFERLSFGSLLQCTASSGVIEGSIIGAREDYSVTVHTGSGDSNLVPGGNGDRVIEMKTSSGDIEVSFEG